MVDVKLQQLDSQSLSSKKSWEVSHWAELVHAQQLEQYPPDPYFGKSM